MAKALHLLSKPEATVRWLSQRLVQIDASDAPELEDLPQEQKQALTMLTREESGGFQGRPEKDADVCYSFWVGAALQVNCTSGLVERPLVLIYFHPHSCWKAIWRREIHRQSRHQSRS